MVFYKLNARSAKLHASYGNCGWVFADFTPYQDDIKKEEIIPIIKLI